MTPERWAQVTDLYQSALELDSTSQREAYLEEACGADEDLRREVESLLEADARAGDFIAEPVIHELAAMMPIKDDAPSLVGKKLAHYRIISRIGAGGMGEVYLGRDVKLNRPVAIKTLPASFAENPNYLRRFQTEAEAAANLNHPNVAVVYSVEKADGQNFITMEYVEGKTLDASIPSGGVDLKTFLELFIPLAGALSHAHEKGVIHRDIKPGNIIITDDGVPKILDFGLAQIERARADESDSTLKFTRPGQVFGTPSYMSPEQAEGNPVDHRTDIFSFGVVMYEAITGERPFKGDSYASIVSNLLKTEPPPVTHFKPETPYFLARLITRCLSKSRRHRFQSMREVRAILEETGAAVEAGISMDSASNPLLIEKSRILTRRWILGPVVLFTALLLAAAFYFFQKRPPAPISFENMTLRKLSQTNDVGFAQITPDGKSVVYNTLEENDRRSLWIRRIDDKNALQLLPPQPAQFWGGFSISPDGSQIFYIASDKNAREGTLYRISSLGGPPRKLVETVNDVGAVSLDGARLLYVRYGERAQILSANPADGSDERVIQTGDENVLYRDPQFSHDGTRIFFSKFARINGEEFWSLVEIPATGGSSGGERVVIPPSQSRIGELAVLKNGGGLLINKTDPVSNLQQLFYVSLSDGRQQRVTNDLNSYFGIGVSHDGQSIVTVQRHYAIDIWVASARDKESRKLTTESNVYNAAVWTPDGRIVYDAVDNNRPHIWIMNGDGTGAQQLTPNDSFDFEPQVSPDGRFIFFTSQRTGERKVWRMNIDGTGAQLLTPVSGAAFAPVVAPDGQTVFFQWARENQKVLGRVPPGGGEITEQPLFGESHWTLSPDGTQVAYSFYDQENKQYKVRVRPLDRDAPARDFNISKTSILLWTSDGKSLLYREIEPGSDLASTIWQQNISGGEPKQFLSVKPDMAFALSQSTNGQQFLIVRGKLFTDAVMLTKIPGR